MQLMDLKEQTRRDYQKQIMEENRRVLDNCHGLARSTESGEGKE
jgi:hypothetical protein